MLSDDSRFAMSWQSDATPTRERRERGSRTITESTFERIYRAFIAARAAIGVALVVTLALTGAFGLRPTLAVIAISVAYAALATSMWLLPRFRRGVAPHTFARLQSPQWLATIGVDLVLFTALHVAAPGVELQLRRAAGPAGAHGRRAHAARARAGHRGGRDAGAPATAWLGLVAGGDATLLMTQAGLAGSGFFVVTVLAGELAGRLAREEMSARGSLEIARQQAQLNRLVIEEMEDGVLVVDRAGKVRAANPAARRLLAPAGTSRAAPFQLRGVPAWGALVRAVERAFAEASWPEARPRRAAPVRPRFAPRRCACACASRASASRRRARSSASSSSRTCAASRRAAARKSSPRWAASRPASRTRSGIRSPPSRRPTRCSPRTRPIPGSAS